MIYNRELAGSDITMITMLNIAGDDDESVVEDDKEDD